MIFLDINHKPINSQKPARIYKKINTKIPKKLHHDGELMKLAHFDEYGRGDQFIFIGKQNRPLSVKECKAIQTPPESLNLTGSLVNKYR